MKKLFTLLAISVLSTGLGHGQCVPGTDFQGTGLTFTPQSTLTPVYTCTGCGDQLREISVQTFTDTMLSVEIQPGNPPLDVTVYADFFRLDSIGGLPEGLTYTTDAAYDTTYDAIENPFGYWINPGDTTNGFDNTNGCISIEGTEAAWNAAVGGGPNNDGVYPLTLFIDARAANFYPAAIGGIVGFNTWLTDMGVLLDAFGDPNFTVNGIKLVGPDLIVVESGVGIEEQNNELGTLTVSPNPVVESTMISFHSKVTEMGMLQVLNSSGQLIYSDALAIQNGQNKMGVNTTGWAKGIYLVSVRTENAVKNTRLMVK